MPDLHDSNKAILATQVQLLTALSVAPDEQWPKRVQDLWPLFASAAATGDAMLRLAEGPYAQQVLMLSRAVIERLVNLGYLLFAEKGEVEKFLRHGTFRTLSAFNRTSKAGDFTFQISAPVTPEMIQELDQLSGEFIGTRGGFKSWTDRTLSQRIGLLLDNEPRAAQIMLVAWATLYPDASEALHGTKYGCLVPYGTPAWASNDKRSTDTTRSMNSTIFFVVGGAMQVANVWLYKRIGVDYGADLARENLYESESWKWFEANYPS